MAAYQQPTGSRFGGDAMYHGTNRGFGVRFAYHFNPKREKDTIAQWDTLRLQIFDGERLIRTLKQKTPVDNGLHYWSWYMDEKGVKRPSKSINKSKREPSGVGVLPGTYKAVLNYGNLNTETTIEVKNDPRLEVNIEAQKAVYKASKQLESYQNTAAKATRQLAESKEIAEDYLKALKKKDKDTYSDTIKHTEDIVKTIEDIFVLFFGKVDERQGITSDPKVSVMERLGTTSYYVSTRPNGLTSTEEILIKNAKNDLTNALELVNSFFENEWKDYRSKIETIDITPFKAIETVHIEN